MDSKIYIFEKAPVPKAVMELVIPTIISQLITMIYNMADTFFVGQLNDPDQVAAVALAARLCLVITALANLFGIGGASLLSRSLGEKNILKAQRASVFGFYAALAVALLCSLAVLLFQEPFLSMLGAFGETRDYTANYLLWVFIIGGAPTLLSMVLAHFVRADGAPRQASLALSMGGVLNMILDPIFIFSGDSTGVTGAAVATLIANLAARFISYLFLQKEKSTVISIDPRICST
jgi:Na+-driven multidrug efflux pump